MSWFKNNNNNLLTNINKYNREIKKHIGLNLIVCVCVCQCVCCQFLNLNTVIPSKFLNSG